MQKLLLVLILSAVLLPVQQVYAAAEEIDQTFVQMILSSFIEGSSLIWGILIIGGCIVVTLIFVGIKKYKAENDKTVNKDSNS